MDREYVSIPECAARMGITEAEVWDLINRHALRAYRWGGWGDPQVEPLVEPAIVNVAPRKRAPRKKARK